MKKVTSLILAVCVSLPLFAQVRGKIAIPDLNAYVTLKCDFHIHTVFSDGLVWPTVRVDEAYREGLDAIAITDHIEYRPFMQDIVASHNRSYEIAQAEAKNLGIILIKGSEITRSMPPGHHNALFITDSDALDKPDYKDAFRAAQAQNAFIFWNHPCWDAQQPDTTLWWSEHTKLFEQGMMQGIEVVNEGNYCPEAHRWCLDKNLTMLGNSDVHVPMQTAIDFSSGKHRPMTLVFASSATAEGIREALVEKRTAVYNDEYVIGEEKYLKELFENALEWEVNKTDNAVHFNIKNKSSLIFRLKKTQHDTRLVYFRDFTIVPHGEHSFSVRLKDGVQGGDVSFIVENFLVQPYEGMKYTIKI